MKLNMVHRTFYTFRAASFSLVFHSSISCVTCVEVLVFLDWKNFINIKNSAKKITVLYIMIHNKLN